MKQFLIVVAIVVATSAVIKGQSVAFEGQKKINGTNLFVKVIGKGEPVLVIHGGPGLNHTYFFPRLNAIAKKYQLIFYDQRASGQSAVPNPDSVTLDFFIEDIEAIRKEFKITKLNLLAHSWGALPAVIYAMDYPDQVKKLVLVNPVPLSTEYNEELAMLQKKRITKQDSVDRSQILSSKSFKDGQAEAYQKLMLMSFRHSFYKSTNYTKLSLTMPSNYVAASRALFTGLGKDLAQYNYYPKLERVTAPLLLIHGTSDVVSTAIQKRLTDAVPTAQLSLFKASGHFSFIDEPDRFRKEVLAFLARK